MVTNKGAGEVLSGKGYKEYRLGEYSNWLQKRVNNTKNWNRIKSCLQDGKVCQSLSQDKVGETVQEFYAEQLSPIQVWCLFQIWVLCSFHSILSFDSVACIFFGSIRFHFSISVFSVSSVVLI